MHDEVLRILDANADRVREALRVLEDYARFVLDDAQAAAALKGCRHELGAFLAKLGPVSPGGPSAAGCPGGPGPTGGRDALLEARDTAGDVGRDVKTARELARGSAEEVVRAEFGRLAEAARSLGEYGKLFSAEVALAAERLRYRAYELEPLVVLRGPLRLRLRAARVCVLVTEKLCRRPWLETVEAVLRGGAEVIQLREKELADAELLRRAGALREVVGGRALIIVNDRPDIARLAGADGVHVGQDDLPVRQARRIAGGRALIGKSTHTPEQVEAAVAEEPDYIAVGPMFASGTKPQVAVAGVALWAAARRATELPLVAIGGITPENVGCLLSAVPAGSQVCVAACAGVIAADDPEQAVRALGAALERRGGTA